MKRLILAFFLILSVSVSFAQSVAFPPFPGNTNKLEPWGYQQVGTNWDTSPFLPFIYNGLKMRLMPPNGVAYNSTTKTWNFSEPGKKYPLLLFFHGNGEQGTDNNAQLRNGGEVHKKAVQNNTFPCFLLYPQSVTSSEGKAILERVITELPVDINQIFVEGLSGGGGKVWEFTIANPTLVAASFPMSASNDGAKTANLLYNSIRQGQGGLDINPAPGWSQTIVDWYTTNGGHLEYFYLPNVGHGTWTSMYALPDFFSWYMSKRKNQIMVRYNRNQICPEVAIDVDMGFTPGFDAYEWRKDGVLMPSETAHKLNATSYGSYTGRIKNRGVWSDWSEPVVVSVKSTTNTPAIQTNGLKSIVLPAPDGSTTTELMLPDGYQSYSWKNASNQVVSTSRVFSNVPTGVYTASANEYNGCATIPSPSFSVINAIGTKSPDAIADFLGYALSGSQVSLSWTDKPSPAYNETSFEVYRSTDAAGAYTLISKVAADAVGYIDSSVSPNVVYYYKIRPVNQYSAGPVSDIISVLTEVDNIAPTAPSNLTVTGTSPTSIALSWTASIDNIGVYRYDVYKDGVKVLTTASTSVTVYNLTAGQTYKLVVKARDLTGNNSTESNLVVASAVLAGFEYKYYESSSAWSVLPNFNTLTPVKTGYSNNIDINVRNRDVNFGFLWQGMINIPMAGSYTFMTNSDDGSKLYIGTYDEANLVVNNDGGHGTQDREGTKTFSAPGAYPIVVTYFQGGGGYAMPGIYWKNTAHGVVTKTIIPNSYFVPAVSGTNALPQPPSSLTATAVAFDKINLTWVDNSNNELGFRVYRSTSNSGPFAPIASLGVNTASYQDQQLAPATTYYYRIVAFGEKGESDLSNQVPRGLAYSYYEAPSIASLTAISSMLPSKTGYSSFFDVALRERTENFALKWVGKINITTAATYTFYTSSDDGSTLHIDGTQVVANDTNGAQHEKSGTKALTVGWHDIEVRWRKNVSTNNRLTVSYARTGMSKTPINSANSAALFYGTEVNAKTQALPPAPAAPTNIVLTNSSPTSFLLTWLDNATDETNFQILRSYGQNTNFVIYKNLPAGSTSFEDTGLFANANYFYKIRVNGAGGSVTSSQIAGTTSNNVPTLEVLHDTTLKFGKTLDVGVYAKDKDNDPLTFVITGLPVFGTFTDYEDGSGNLQFTPNNSQLGQYTITVTAQDNHSGSVTATFTLTINDKDVPVISSIVAPTVMEGKSANLVLSATSDYGAENLVWSFTGLPEFASVTSGGGYSTVSMSPGYIHSGAYPVEVSVTDPLGSISKSTFVITVQDQDPNSRIYVNIVNSTTASTPWNNMNSLTLNALKDEYGNTTTVGLAFQTNAWNTYSEGAVTGNNSGVFPDNVIKDYYYFGIFGAPETVDVKISGLDVLRKYNLGFFGSSKWDGVADNGSTVYAVGSTTFTLSVQNNKWGVARIKSITPAADGSIVFKMSKAAGTSAGYLNALTLEALFEDGTVPVPPRNIQAAYVEHAANVSWVDAPFNEEGFDIYRSTSETGTYTKINQDPIAKNTISYTDNTVQDGVTYYYKLKAFNNYGESPFSAAGVLVIPDTAPRIDISGSLTIDPDVFNMVSVTSSSDATLTINNLPSFAFLSPVSNSAADIILLPGATDTGTYPVTIVAIDSHGLSTTQTVSLKVNEKILSRIYVNLGQSYNASLPWNNTAKTPTANDTFSNLKNDANVGSGVNLILQTAFGGVYSGGPNTGNNLGIVPDAVLREYYWFGYSGAASEINMKVTGLSPVNKYRFKFVASSVFNAEVASATTIFTIGAKTSSVNVYNNTTKFAIIEDVITNASGEVTIKASKGGTATAGYLNGIIIEALPVDPSQFNPSGLTAAGLSKTQISLTWSDNSPVETGYEIYRSTTGSEGSYSLITTTAPDVTTYTDVVPVQNQLYYYKVRGATSSGSTAYTNVARSSTISFKVFINISHAATYDAPAPWNNISRFGFAGDIFYGFKSDANIETGMRFRVQTALESSNASGMTTGNNSGIFPDKVLQSFWFNDAYFPQGEFVIDGLDQAFSYNFGFMGTYNVPNVVNTNFTINGVTVTNRNDKNTTSVSYLRNIAPNADGEILFTVREAPGSPWSIFNAMVIEAFATGGQSNISAKTAQSSKSVTGNLQEIRFGEGANKMEFYPNPVVSEMNVSLRDASLGVVSYQVYDLMGRELKSGSYNNNLINSEFKIDVDLPAAVYLLKLTYADGRFEARKFMKN